MSKRSFRDLPQISDIKTIAEKEAEVAEATETAETETVTNDAQSAFIEPEPKVEAVTEVVAVAMSKEDLDKVAIPSSPEVVAVAAESEPEVLTAAQAIYANKNSDEIFAMFGGTGFLGVVSAAIRAMHAAGFKNGDIAKRLGKRYQHVRNVLHEPTKKPIPVPNAAKVTLPVVSIQAMPTEELLQKSA
jgi:hypothetical protein